MGVKLKHAPQAYPPRNLESHQFNVPTVKQQIKTNFT